MFFDVPYVASYGVERPSSWAGSRRRRESSDLEEGERNEIWTANNAASRIKILGRSSSPLPCSRASIRTGRAFGAVLAALGEVEALLLVPAGVVKHGKVVAGGDGRAVALARVDVVDVVPVAL